MWQKYPHSPARDRDVSWKENKCDVCILCFFSGGFGFGFETMSHSVVQTGLERAVGLLSEAPKCWDHRPRPRYLTCFGLLRSVLMTGLCRPSGLELLTTLLHLPSAGATGLSLTFLFPYLKNKKSGLLTWLSGYWPLPSSLPVRV